MSEQPKCNRAAMVQIKQNYLSNVRTEIVNCVNNKYLKYVMVVKLVIQICHCDKIDYDSTWIALYLLNMHHPLLPLSTYSDSRANLGVHLVIQYPDLYSRKRRWVIGCGGSEYNLRCSATVGHEKYYRRKLHAKCGQ